MSKAPFKEVLPYTLDQEEVYQRKLYRKEKLIARRKERNNRNSWLNMKEGD